MREANQVADGFAKFGLSIDIQIRVFNFSPNFIVNALRADESGVCFPRDF